MSLVKMRLVIVLLILTIAFVGQATAQETKAKWFGHAAFSISTPNGKVLLIDPWLKNLLNPEAKDGKDPLALIPKVSLQPNSRKQRSVFTR